jgi:hypothetical protein
VDNLVISKAGEFADFLVSGPKETRGKYAELGVSGAKLAAVAKALFKAGNNSQAVSVADRALVKNMGRELGQSKYFARQRPIGNWTKAGDTIENLQTLRGGTRSVFPKRPGPGKQPGSTLRRSERKEILSPPVGKAKRVLTAGEKYRAKLGGKVTRVAELEKRLNLPKRGR